MAKAEITDEIIHLNLMDEIPRIGSGRRGVKLTALGYKWVRILYPPTGINVRIKRKLWDQLIA